jgi:hypothetical protein
LFSFPVEVQVRHRSCARCAQAGWKFRTYQPKRELKTTVARSCTESKELKYLDVFEECRKEYVQKSHRRFEFEKGISGEFAPSRC